MSSYLWINDHNDQSQINQYNNQIAQSNMNTCAPMPSSEGSIDYGSTNTVVTGGGGGGYNATCDDCCDDHLCKIMARVIIILFILGMAIWLISIWLHF